MYIERKYRVTGAEVNEKAGNPVKNLIRNAIVNQTRAVAVRVRPSLFGLPFVSATIPGTNFIFEEMLTASLEYEGICSAFDCSDINKSRHAWACNAGTPPNVSYRCADFTALPDDNTSAKYHMMFADTNSTATLEFIKKLVKAANYYLSMPDGLFYGSFNMRNSYRQDQKDQLGIADGQELDVALSDVISRELTALKVKHAPVYRAVYCIGPKNGTKMLTLGFHLNPSFELKPVNQVYRYGDSNGLSTIRTGLRMVSVHVRSRPELMPFYGQELAQKLKISGLAVLGRRKT